MMPSSPEKLDLESKRHNILIVDDEPANLQVLSTFLRDYGYEITIARNGTKALERVRYTLPDLILLDVAMPGMDGFETCRQLKLSQHTKDIPIIFLTALTSQEDKVKGFQAGGVDYVTKPIQFEELLARVQTHLSLHAMHKHLEELVKARTAELDQVNRMLRILSYCNQSLVRATDENALLEEICHTIVELGGYPMTWIGYVERDAPIVRPIAQRGFGSLAELDAERELALVEAALNSCTHQILSDIQQPSSALDEYPTNQHPYASIIALPLCEDDHALGVLTIYAQQVDAFHQTEVDLLIELADDLAYGIVSLRTRAERRRAEEALRTSEERYRDLFEESPISLWEEDFSLVKQRLEQLRLDGVIDFRTYFESHPGDVIECARLVKILDVNQATLVLLGATDKHQLMVDLGKLLADEALIVFREELVAFANGELQFKGDEIHRTFSDEIKYITLNTRVAPGYEDSLGKVLVSMLDMTDKTLAEAALRASEEKYRRMVDTATEGILALDANLCINFFNARLAEMLGYSANELMGQEFVSFVFDDDLSEHQQRMAERRRGEIGHYEQRLRRKDGQAVWLLISATPILDAQQNFQGSFAMLADITERKRAETEQVAIYQIADAAISVDNLDELFRSIHQILGDLIPANNFYIALYHEATDTFSYPYWVDEYDETPAQESVGCSPTGYVLRTKQSLLASPEVFEMLAEQSDIVVLGTPPIDWAGVPLKVENRLIGVMAVQSYSETIRYGKKELSILEFVSSQVAMAIERKQSEDALHRRLKELTVLHAIATAAVRAATEDNLIEQATQIMGDVLYTDNFGVLLLDEETKDLHFHPSYRGLSDKSAHLNIALGETIVGHVAFTGKPWHVSNVHAEPLYRVLDSKINAELCVPMKVNDQVIGVINAESVQRNAFTEADKWLLETVASQLATAIKKVRLFDETNRHLLRLNALHTIDKAITSGGNLNITLEVLLDQALNRLEVDAVDILMFNINTQTLEYTVGRGFRTQSFQRFSIHIEGLYRRIVMERTPVYIPNLADSGDELLHVQRMIGEGFVAYYAIPFVSKGQVKGIIEVYRRTPLQVRQEWVDFLVALASQAAIAIENTSLFDALQRSNQELTVSYDATLEGWSRALELRDQETEGHSQRVTDFTVQLAKLMGVSDAELVHIRRGALLHDIGKMGIPDSILFKSSELSEQEWEIMRQHPAHAFAMLSPIPYLRPALDIPFYHHEKWNGSGYPTGLKGEQIPLAARIFAIVDVWDALTSDRPYRNAWPKEKVIEHILSQTGLHFDPQIVDLFLKFIEINGSPAISVKDSL